MPKLTFDMPSPSTTVYVAIRTQLAAPYPANTKTTIFDAASFTVKTCAVDPPSNLQLASASESTITLTWTHSDFLGGRAKSEVEYCIAYGETETEKVCIAYDDNNGQNTEQTKTISGLTKSTSYDFKVFAKPTDGGDISTYLEGTFETADGGTFEVLLDRSHTATSIREGDAFTYTVGLTVSPQPGENVTVNTTVTSSGGEDGIFLCTRVGGDTPLVLSDTMPSVNVTILAGSDDVDQDADPQCLVNHVITASSDANYADAVSASSSLVEDFTVRDDDSAGVTLLWDGYRTAFLNLHMEEMEQAGVAQEYNVTLLAKPQSSVNVTLALTNKVQENIILPTVSPTTLTFTPETWAYAQRISVTAYKDYIDGTLPVETFEIVHTVTTDDAVFQARIDADAQMKAMKVVLQVKDVDRAGIHINATGTGDNSVLIAGDRGSTFRYIRFTGFASVPQGDVEMKIQVCYPSDDPKSNAVVQAAFNVEAVDGNSAFPLCQYFNHQDSQKCCLYDAVEQCEGGVKWKISTPSNDMHPMGDTSYDIFVYASSADDLKYSANDDVENPCVDLNNENALARAGLGDDGGIFATTSIIVRREDNSGGPSLHVDVASDSLAAREGTLFLHTVRVENMVESVQVTAEIVEASRQYCTFHPAIQYEPSHLRVLTIGMNVSSVKVRFVATDNNIAEDPLQQMLCRVTYTNTTLGTPKEGLTSVTNDDSAGAALRWDNLETPVLPLRFREGEGRGYEIVLKSKPIGTIEVYTNVTKGSGSSSRIPFSVNPVKLEFTSKNWNVPQQVNVSSTHDNIDGALDEEKFTVTHTINKTAIHGSADFVFSDVEDLRVVATVTDIDTAGIALLDNVQAMTANEGAAAVSFTVQALKSKPVSTVTVRITSTCARLVVSPSQFEVAPSEWQTVKKIVDVTAEEGIEQGPCSVHLVAESVDPLNPKYNHTHSQTAVQASVEFGIIQMVATGDVYELKIEGSKATTSGDQKWEFLEQIEEGAVVTYDVLVTNTW